MTLTAASTVVFSELIWTPSMMQQAEDRVHRIGQLQSVNIYYLIAKDTLDEGILSMLNYKNKVIVGTLEKQESRFVFGENKFNFLQNINNNS